MPDDYDMVVWQLVTKGISLKEIDEHWTLIDLLDAKAMLDYNDILDSATRGM